MSWTTWLSWSIHLIGSLSILVSSLDEHAADEQRRRRPRRCIGRDLGRQAAELDDEVLDPETLRLALRRLLELADAERAIAGTTIPTITSTTIPTAEQHAEVADHRHLRDAQREEGGDAGDRGGDQRRREVGERLADRVLLVVEQHLLLDPVVDLDREVDAEPDQDRAARRSSRARGRCRSDPSSEKLHSTPISTASSGSSRQRTLKISHSTIAITTIAASAERAASRPGGSR